MFNNSCIMLRVLFWWNTIICSYISFRYCTNFKMWLSTVSISQGPCLCPELVSRSSARPTMDPGHWIRDPTLDPGSGPDPWALDYGFARPLGRSARDPEPWTLGSLGHSSARSWTLGPRPGARADPEPWSARQLCDFCKKIRFLYRTFCKNARRWFWKLISN